MIRKAIKLPNSNIYLASIVETAADTEDEKDTIILQLYDALEAQKNKPFTLNLEQTNLLREALAPVLHARWSLWVERMLKKCKIERKIQLSGEAQTVGTIKTGAMIIPKDYLHELIRHTQPNFNRLNESQREFNLSEADKIISIINDVLNSKS